MTALLLARGELRRLTSGRLPWAALIAMLLIPSLYGGFYLYANKDPYRALGRVPAAVVVEDAGTTLATGTPLNAGQQVSEQLATSHSFDWHRVSRERADAGVNDGTYNFALVVPKDFSAALASSADFKPRQAMLQLETNDSNGYLSRTIANNVVAEVTQPVASQVSSTAASQLLTGFSTIHDKTAKAAEGAAQLDKGAQDLHAGALRLSDGAGSLVAGERKLVQGSDQLTLGADQAAAGGRSLSSGASTLHAGLTQMDQQTAALPAQTRRLSDGAKQVASGNAKVAAVGQELAHASGDFVTAMTSRQGGLAARLKADGLSDQQVADVLSEATALSRQLSAGNANVQQTSAQLDQLSHAAGQVADGADALAAGAAALKSGVHRAAEGSARLETGASRLAEGNASLASGAGDLATGQRMALDGASSLDKGAGQLADGSGTLAKGAHDLAAGLQQGLKSIPNPSAASRKAVAQTLGSPVGVRDTSLAAAATYGAGLAPYFLSLALWIGAYVLYSLLLRPLSVRALAAGQPAWRTALGGWLPSVLLGVLQAALAFVVVVPGVGIAARNPVGLLFFLFAVSITFMMIMHALAARLGAVGKFLGLVLMVLQLISAGGTFPWQTLPLPLHPLHHLLPMSYAVDGIRRLMYGGSLVHLGLDLAVFAAYGLGAFLVSTVAARRARVWTPARLRPELAI